MSNHTKEYIRVLNAIQQDLIFTDERDEDDFFVLVDENREVDAYKPKKSLVKNMESLSLITAIEKETKREYVKFRGQKRPLSLISIFQITEQGEQLLKNK